MSAAVEHLRRLVAASPHFKTREGDMCVYCGAYGEGHRDDCPYHAAKRFLVAFDLVDGLDATWIAPGRPKP